MKKLLLVIILFLSPFIILADEFDDYPSSGKPFWHYFDYKVTYPDGATESGKIKVCASNAVVALGTGRSILLEKYGQCSVSLGITARGAGCSEERTGEIY